MEIEDVASKIVAAAIKVHTALGPGLLESAYQKCIQYELQKSELKVECEVALPVVYDKVKIDAGYRIDMVVDGSVIIENKTVADPRSSIADLFEDEKMQDWFFTQLECTAHEGWH